MAARRRHTEGGGGEEVLTNSRTTGHYSCDGVNAPLSPSTFSLNVSQGRGGGEQGCIRRGRGGGSEAGGGGGFGWDPSPPRAPLWSLLAPKQKIRPPAPNTGRGGGGGGGGSGGGVPGGGGTPSPPTVYGRSNTSLGVRVNGASLDLQEKVKEAEGLFDPDMVVVDGGVGGAGLAQRPRSDRTTIKSDAPLNRVPHVHHSKPHGTQGPGTGAGTRGASDRRGTTAPPAAHDLLPTRGPRQHLPGTPTARAIAHVATPQPIPLREWSHVPDMASYSCHFAPRAFHRT